MMLRYPLAVLIDEEESVECRRPGSLIALPKSSLSLRAEAFCKRELKKLAHLSSTPLSLAHEHPISSYMLHKPSPCRVLASHAKSR